MIPAASTTITVERNDSFDPDEDAEWTTVATGIRAHIDATAAPSTIAGQTVTAELYADLCDLKLGDRVTDEWSGESYQAAVSVLRQVTALGLDHVRASLVAVQC